MKIAFLASPRSGAQAALVELIRLYGQNAVADADYVVTVGGDGTALKALRLMLPMPAKPVFAMRMEGSIGFLCNPFRTRGLIERLHSCASVELPVLQADVEQNGGQRHTFFGINEIVLIRQRLQEAKLHISFGGQQDPIAIAGDGVILATPVGSTAYSHSLGGPRLPIAAALFVLTGIAIRRPADWSPIVLEDGAILDVDVIEPIHHPVRMETDIDTIPNICRAHLLKSRDHKVTLLFNRETENDVVTRHGALRR